MKYTYSNIILLFLSFNLYGQNGSQKVEAYNELKYILNDPVDTLIVKKTSEYFQEYSDSLIYFVFNDITSLKTYNINSKELPDISDVVNRPHRTHLIYNIEDKRYVIGIFDRVYEKRDTLLLHALSVYKTIGDNQYSINKKMNLFSKMEMPTIVMKIEFNYRDIWSTFLGKKGQIALRRNYPSNFNVCNTKYAETNIEYINKIDSTDSFVVAIREIVDRWCEDKSGNTTVQTGIRLVSGDKEQAKKYLQNEYNISTQSDAYEQHWMFDDAKLSFINGDNIRKWGGFDNTFLRLMNAQAKD